MTSHTGYMAILKRGLYSETLLSSCNLRTIRFKPILLLLYIYTYKESIKLKFLVAQGHKDIKGKHVCFTKEYVSMKLLLWNMKNVEAILSVSSKSMKTFTQTFYRRLQGYVHGGWTYPFEQIYTVYTYSFSKFNCFLLVRSWPRRRLCLKWFKLIICTTNILFTSSDSYCVLICLLLSRQYLRHDRKLHQSWSLFSPITGTMML